MVENVDYDQLCQAPTLTDNFKKAVQTGVAAQAGPPITADDVSVKLSAGSVVAHVTVTPKSGAAVPSSATSKLQSKAGVSNAIVGGVSKVSGISSVSTGKISATSFASCTECGAAVNTPSKQKELTDCGLSGGNPKHTSKCYNTIINVYSRLKNECCHLAGGNVEKDCHVASYFMSPMWRCLAKTASNIASFPSLAEKLYKPVQGTGAYAECMKQVKSPTVSLTNFAASTKCPQLKSDTDIVSHMKTCCGKQGAPSDCEEAIKIFAYTTKCLQDDQKCA